MWFCNCSLYECSNSVRLNSSNIDTTLYGLHGLPRFEPKGICMIVYDLVIFNTLVNMILQLGLVLDYREEELTPLLIIRNRE